MSVIEKIDNIELKVRQMLLHMERLEKENKDLQAENKELKTAVDRHKGVAEALKIKLAKTQLEMDEKREGETRKIEDIKNQIDQYMTIIDECIEWLQHV